MQLNSFFVIMFVSVQSISSEVMEALDNRPVSIRLKGLVRIYF